MASSGDHVETTTELSRTSPASPSQRASLSGSSTRFIVLMGVSGTGKSTLGEALSAVMHIPFIDGDDLQPAANVAKMARGMPLDDADRQPWLETVREIAIARVLDQVGRAEPAGNLHAESTEGLCWRPGVIVACSALKKTYRAMLRGEVATADAVSVPTYFVYLKGDREVLMARMLNRKGHYMKAGMLESQLDTLESPEGEPGVVSVEAEMTTEEQVRRVTETFRSWERNLSTV